MPITKHRTGKVALIVFTLTAVGGFTYLMGAGRHWIEPATTSMESVHYSPDENLERLELAELSKARQTLDIEAYSFTDRSIARKLIELARRGVKIRIVRDGSEYLAESKRPENTANLLYGVCNVQIRVKPLSRSNLMHEKCWSADGKLLRLGSANWSPSGLKRQDNFVLYTNNRAEIEQFEANFEEVFNRVGNVIAQ